MKNLNTAEIKKNCSNYSMFTWVPQKYMADPQVMTAEDGCYYYNEEGNKIFDLSSGLVYVNAGYNNKTVIDSIKKQLDELPVGNPRFATEIRSKTAKKILTEFAPDNMGKVMFTLGGADANEYAIRIAKAYTGRTTIMSQYDSYHGSTYGASNLTGEDSRSSMEPCIPGFVHFVGPNWHDIPIEGDDEAKTEFLLAMLRYQISMEQPESIAAIFMETITGSNGVYVPTASFYRGLRQICDEYGILLVCDEVMVGFCRTGKYFACENYDIQPDIITFAKGSTSGYVPMGGVLISKKIAEFFNEAEFPCGLTYNSHPLSLAACLGNLNFYQESNILEHVNTMGKILKEGLEALKEKHDCISEVRGVGLMLLVQLKPEFCTEEASEQWVDYLMEHGYSSYGNEGQIMITPPLVVNEEEVQGIIDVIDGSLKQFD